jgi:acyl dehydratase
VNYKHLKNRLFDDVRQRYGASDTILYALGVGMGSDPGDLKQLRYVYGDDLLALPTMATVLGSPAFWMRSPDAALDWQNIVHLEQELTLHRPLKASGDVVGKTVVEAIVDKRSQGALLSTRCDLFDATTSELIANMRSANLCRGDGHFGGTDTADAPPKWRPLGPPDITCILPTFPQSALIYGLSGDDNPLHADMRVAQGAGFDRPVLQGLCTFGIAGHAALRVFCDYAPERLKKLRVRFAAPLYPGESVRTTFWHLGRGTAAFQCHSVERNVMVIHHGFVEYVESAN